MRIVNIVGGRIDEVWLKAIKACVEVGHTYVIDKGEYEGQKRREFDLAVLNIKTPGIRPLACQSSCITPTTDSEIEKYFQNYLMNPEFDDEKEAMKNEYKYATWIAPIWQQCCDLLVKGQGGCNQATISTDSRIPKLHIDKKTKWIRTEGRREEEFEYIDSAEIRFDILKQPPCLRVIDMRIRYGKLHFIVYFRSWDLIAGFPENIGGLQLMKEWCLDYINLELSDRQKPLLQDGEIIGISKGLHIYDHFWDMAMEYSGTESSVYDIPGITIIE